jgi:hypothetical protein
MWELISNLTKEKNLLQKELAEHDAKVKRITDENVY